LFRIAREFKQPLHESLKSLAVNEYPYSIQFLIHKRMQVESWYELPKEKQPPQDIWFKPKELEDWFERIYGDKQTEFEFKQHASEIED